MEALVTGGAGFIGSNLVRCLAACGERVRVIDNLSTGSTSNLKDVDSTTKVIVADVRDPEPLDRAMAGVEVVFHLASPPPRAPERAHEEIEGTIAVLDAARKHSVGRVVFASSSSVYGRTGALPLSEDLPRLPATAHGAAKAASEDCCYAYERRHGIEPIVLRLFDVFGPRQDLFSEYPAVIPKMVARMVAGDPPIIEGDGYQTRDFTSISNAVQALVLAATARGSATEAPINVGCGMRTSLLEIVDMLEGILGTDVRPVFLEERPGDTRHVQADIDRAKQVLGYHPLTGVLEGLVQTVRWLEETKRNPRTRSGLARSA
jgi:UDP-glucose 4-epimerase